MEDLTEVIGFINNSHQLAVEAFAPLKAVMFQFSMGIPALGFAIYFIYNYLFKLFGTTKMIDLHVDKLMVYALLMSFMLGYNELMNQVDFIFKIPQKTMFNVMSSQASTMYVKIEKFQKEALEKEIEARKRYEVLGVNDQIIETSKALARLPQKIGLLVYALVLIFAVAVFIAIILLQITMGLWGAQLMIALGSLAFGLQFIPAYSGILANYFKNLLAVNIVVATVAGFGAAAFQLKIFDYIFNLLTDITVSMYSENQELSFDVLPIIILIILCYLAGSIPSFVDKVINTSAGGAFSGAMTGAALMGAATSMAKAGSMQSIHTGSSLVGSGIEKGVSIGKKIAGGVQSGAELLDESAHSIVSESLKKMGNRIDELNPLHQEKVEAFGQKIGNRIAEGLDQLTQREEEKNGADDYLDARGANTKIPKEKSSKSTDIDEL